MKKTLSSLVVSTVLGLALLAAPTTSSALVLLDDNFNGEHGGVGVLNYTGFANWMVSDGAVDLIGNGYFDFLPGNGLYVDMDGSTGNAGMMTSTLLLTPGTYEISFDLAGNHRNSSDETLTVKVGLGTLLNENFSLAQNAPFTPYTRTFVVASDTSVALSFEGVGSDNIGMLLDDVKLSQVQVPEPATMLLLGLGLVGLAGIRRKM